uniref:Uncharacterized protein n=1 Tax=Vitis vinifera TaxID=29760 RepID=F6HVA2_VITVI
MEIWSGICPTPLLNRWIPNFHHGGKFQIFFKWYSEKGSRLLLNS